MDEAVVDGKNGAGSARAGARHSRGPARRPHDQKLRLPLSFIVALAPSSDLYDQSQSILDCAYIYLLFNYSFYSSPPSSVPPCCLDFSHLNICHFSSLSPPSIYLAPH